MEFELMSLAGGVLQDLKVAIAEQLARVGITVHIEDVPDAATALTRMIDRDYVAAIRRSSFFVDPFSDLNIYFPSGERLNYCNCGSPELDEMLAIGATSLDRDERKAAYDRAQELMAEILPTVNLHTSVMGVIMQPYVEGYGTARTPEGLGDLGQHLTPILIDELWRSDIGG